MNIENYLYIFSIDPIHIDAIHDAISLIGQLINPSQSVDDNTSIITQIIQVPHLMQSICNAMVKLNLHDMNLKLQLYQPFIKLIATYSETFIKYNSQELLISLLIDNIDSFLSNIQLPNINSQELKTNIIIIGFFCERIFVVIRYFYFSLQEELFQRCIRSLMQMNGILESQFHENSKNYLQEISKVLDRNNGFTLKLISSLPDLPSLFIKCFELINLSKVSMDSLTGYCFVGMITFLFHLYKQKDTNILDSFIDISAKLCICNLGSISDVVFTTLIDRLIDRIGSLPDVNTQIETAIKLFQLSIFYTKTSSSIGIRKAISKRILISYICRFNFVLQIKMLTVAWQLFLHCSAIESTYSHYSYDAIVLIGDLIGFIKPKALEFHYTIFNALLTSMRLSCSRNCIPVIIMEKSYRLHYVAVESLISYHLRNVLDNNSYQTRCFDIICSNCFRNLLNLNLEASNGLVALKGSQIKQIQKLQSIDILAWSLILQISFPLNYKRKADNGLSSISDNYLEMLKIIIPSLEKKCLQTIDGFISINDKSVPIIRQIRFLLRYLALLFHIRVASNNFCIKLFDSSKDDMPNVSTILATVFQIVNLISSITSSIRVKAINDEWIAIWEIWSYCCAILSSTCCEDLSDSSFEVSL